MTILSTENAISISMINSTYFNDSLDLSEYGNLANITQFTDNYSGIIKTNIIVVNADNIKLVLFDGLILKEIKVREGINHFYGYITSNNWGFLLFPSSVITIVSTVTIDEILPIFAPEHPITYSTIGNVKVDIFNRKTIINTSEVLNTTISNELFGTASHLKNAIKPFVGKKGSALIINNLENGKYTVNVSLGKYDKNQNDSLLVYNGTFYQLSNVNELLIQGSTITRNVEIEVVEGFIYLIALDSVKSSGQTEFILDNVSKKLEEIHSNNGTEEQLNIRLGGDIVNWKMQINLSENKQIKFTTDKAVIWQIIGNNAVIYDEEYVEEIEYQLSVGEYILSLSTESSMEEDYVLNLMYL
ncbi:hypothetical protein [Geminocystis sp. GBBB08]|uniref:hypothetical protein n=1 Tax=Geminocystis sp. GBBB08 TaxID=2604140 RepID=UPI0027E34182|nr:hypothetical protein [Geminocystis sp. GBBB08]MBL1208260.1 hypothetical protein [Geminocystis sp. GBBB08]